MSFRSAPLRLSLFSRPRSGGVLGLDGIGQSRTSEKLEKEDVRGRRRPAGEAAKASREKSLRGGGRRRVLRPPSVGEDGRERDGEVEVSLFFSPTRENRASGGRQKDVGVE